MRQDHEDVRLLADERLDLGDLGCRVVRTLRKHQLDAELVSLCAGVVCDRLEPTVVGAGGAERDLDGTAAYPAGLLGCGGLLASRLLRLLRLLSLLGAGREREGLPGRPRRQIFEGASCALLSFLWFGFLWEPGRKTVAGGRLIAAL